MQFSRSDLADLTYFLEIAKHRNFRRAAVELGLSASALSHALRGLEERVGVRLLNRTSRSVTLTAAGEELRPRSRNHSTRSIVRSMCSTGSGIRPSAESG